MHTWPRRSMLGAAVVGIGVGAASDFVGVLVGRLLGALVVGALVVGLA